MRNIRISPLLLLLIFSYMLIQGSFMPLWILFFSMLHETGHLIALRLLGGKCFGFNGAGQGFGLRISGLSYTQELLVAAAGPLISLLLAALFALLRHQYFCYANLFLALMNLLPILPLDGGRILRAALAPRLPLPLQQGFFQAIALIFLLPLIAFAFWQFLSSGYNISLLLICIYLLGLLKENGNDV